MKTCFRIPGCSSGSRHAFTFVELVALVGIAALLALTAAPAFTRAKPGTRSSQCLGNMRAIAAAWQMYAQENNDKMVIALHGGATMGGAGDPKWGVSWVSGWLDWTTSTDNTNVLLLAGERYAKLAKYTRQPRIFECPSDNYLSPVQIARGWAQRVRSYSQNIYIGEGNAEAGPVDPFYLHIRRTSEFADPGPAEAWVFIEEHPDSINDPAFFAPHRTSWIDSPSTLHNGAAPLAFADGHAEMHQWEGSLSRGRAAQIQYNDTGVGIVTQAGDSDIHWMSYHSVRQSSSSY